MSFVGECEVKSLRLKMKHRAARCRLLCVHPIQAGGAATVLWRQLSTRSSEEIVNHLLLHSQESKMHFINMIITACHAKNALASEVRAVPKSALQTYFHRSEHEQQ